jgi:C4-dicarboxylate-specific signal transduction histidine kinase
MIRPPVVGGPKEALTRQRFLRVTSIALLALAVGVNAQASAPLQKNVLILTSEDTFRPGFLPFVQGFRAALDESSTNHFEYFIESLDQSRFPEAQYGARRLEYLRWKYDGRHLDAILAGPLPALDFLIAHRDELFPGVPVVFASADEDLVRQRQLPPGFTGLPTRFDVAATLDLALRLQPDTRQVVVVVGKSAFDQSWKDIAQAAFRPFKPRLSFRYLDDLPLPAMLEEVSHLPPHSVVMYFSVLADVAGATRAVLEAGQEITRRANAPVYSPYEIMIGRGAVGGCVSHSQADARRVAALALRILNGEDSSSIPVQPTALTVDTVDWRAMQRWQLSKARLRPGTEVRFRQPTFWEQYKWRLIAIHAVAVAEGLLIFILLRNRRRLQRTQGELRESQERLNLATSSARIGVWSWNVKTGRFEATPECRELLGWGPNEPLDYERSLQRVCVEDRALVQRSIDDAIQHRTIFDTEYRVTLPDEQIRWIAARGQCHYANGSATDMVGVVMDITARRQAELTIQRQQGELAHISRVSTMGQLASALAHELNQPLGAILRNAEAAELFLKSPTPDLEELRAIIADIHRDDQRAGNVIESLRLLLKRRDIEMRPLDPRKLAEEVTTLVRAEAIGRRVTIELKAAPALPLVRGDRVQLQQVLLNLIMNGMDAVGASVPEKRRVKLSARHDGNGFVEVAISDSGAGIPPAIMQGMFQPFVTTKAQGMGMGLLISRTIVEAHGGRISAQNNPEGGATFRFTVPIANGDGNTNVSPINASSTPAAK